MNLFVYGTLMDEELVYSLTRRRFRRNDAELPGFARFAPPAGYPYILPRAGARVRGILLSGIDPASLAALDRYEDEGTLYRRRRVQAIVRGRPVPCDTYVGAEALLTRGRPRR
jgi:gamma-glutamylcyclotransferase (GGCT)/AIG2-like uncharacterized protein YtfP